MLVYPDEKLYPQSLQARILELRVHFVPRDPLYPLGEGRALPLPDGGTTADGILEDQANEAAALLLLLAGSRVAMHDQCD